MQRSPARMRGEWAYAEMDVTEFVRMQGSGFEADKHDRQPVAAS
ncbi:hypothetical protein [Dyadobacter flavalbus]|nr:hypothetical protein [Dyadobacter flavalbus]